MDLGRLEQIEGDEGMALSLYEDVAAPPGEARLKVYRIGPPLSLSEVLPILSTTGVEVVDERPYQLEGLPRESYIYDFGLRYTRAMPDHVRELFQDTVAAVWNGYNESDGFNALVLAAGLTWRQATLLRAYAKYMRQGGTPFAQDYIEDALRNNVDITRYLVQLFEARFDPGRPGRNGGGIPADSEARQAKCADLEERIQRALDEVSSLDHDRILRSYLTNVRATLRTNFFQTGKDGQPLQRLSLKFDPSAIPDLPEPRPKFEIFVYSPRVEGVHLRFGSVARGGLRWSDRRDDFRTEVLGLVKAQMVKNTVIVPVGAKGGFFAKQLPDPADRDAWMAEGVACYTTFISGLLDVTDNLVDGEVVPPRAVVRHDADDPYLVVAADKGTATFSDIANEISADYGFWLGDAFASGGSVGYDHKAMGITARGAWVSVRRHFREMGVDSQSEDFTVRRDRRHVRRRLRQRDALLRAHPAGGGLRPPRHLHRPEPRLGHVVRRTQAALRPAALVVAGLRHLADLRGRRRLRRAAPSRSRSRPQMREVLGIEEENGRMTPAELMRAILLAPVDLLWNGGIGTYVKARTETHADAGDKANDSIRVDGHELRVKCVGEGGNLGLTQRGRIEYAGTGGRIDTDFIDNSAGVDTSDHEVNIKILLDRVVADGDLTNKQRNQLLASMTNEVADLVLADNYDQNIALANAVAISPALLHVHEDWMRTLERGGLLNRELEALPTRREVSRTPRAQGGPHRTRAGGADGLHQDRAGGGPAPQRPARRPVPALRAVLLLPGEDAAGLPRPDGAAPAASRDRGHPGGQPAGQQRRHHLLPPARGRDQRDHGRADQGQLRGPRDLRRRQPPARDLVLRQQARRRRADAHAPGEPDARRAGLSLAAQLPPHLRGHRVGRQHLRGGRREGDGRAARRCWSGASSGLRARDGTRSSRRASRRTWRSGWRCARRRT